MTGYLSIIIDQVIIFGLLMAVGFVSAKTGVINRQGLTTLSSIIIKIVIPALIFTIIAAGDVAIEEFAISGRFALAVLLSFTLLFSAGIITGRLFRLEGKKANVFVALMTFGNMGFMGIPLIQAVFREPAAQVSISVYALIDLALLWTLGVYLCSRHQKSTGSLSALRNMINPTTVTLFISFIIMALELPLPRLLTETIVGIGGTSQYLTLFYLGASMAYVSFRKAVSKPALYVLVAVKMLIMPVVIYLLLGSYLPETPKTIMALIVGLPSMTTIAMIARTYGSDDIFASEIIFVTTLFSLVTITLVSTIIGFL